MPQQATQSLPPSHPPDPNSGTFNPTSEFGSSWWGLLVGASLCSHGGGKAGRGQAEQKQSCSAPRHQRCCCGCLGPGSRWLGLRQVIHLGKAAKAGQPQATSSWEGLPSITGCSALAGSQPKRSWRGPGLAASALGVSSVDLGCSGDTRTASQWQLAAVILACRGPACSPRGAQAGSSPREGSP